MINSVFNEPAWPFPHAACYKQAAFLLLLLVMLAVPARAIELWSDPDTGRHAILHPTLKITGMASLNPDDPFLYPERRSGTIRIRQRFDLEMRLSDAVTAELAYEHRARRDTRAGGTALGAGALTAFAPAPWRITALDWSLADHDDRFAWRHEIDRASIIMRPEWGTITAGRQAIGFGRGILFSALDIFSPFSPVEVDREWRRGVDALRVEYRTTPLTALEVLGVFGDRWENSALLARFSGYVGDIDGELLIGKRARDAMLGVAMSAELGGAALHGEMALFRTPEKQVEGGLFGRDNLVAKMVAGASYTFNVGNGLTMIGEYHYSGFGLKNLEKALYLVLDQRFTERLLRGDSQILGRHAMALQSFYPVNDVLTGTLLILASLTDGSGLVSPTLVWSASQRTTLTMSAFVPWGSKPKNGRLQSEYGTSPLSFFGQVSVYF